MNTTTNRKPGHTHIGRCTTGPTWTRKQAHERLAEMGFTFNPERGDWERGNERGQLNWNPDFCDSDNLNVGTEFYLYKPHGAGRIEVLGG